MSATLTYWLRVFHAHPSAAPAWALAVLPSFQALSAACALSSAPRIQRQANTTLPLQGMLMDELP